MIKWSEHLQDAPCYWEVADDGAEWRCKDCGTRCCADEVYGVLTPDGKFRILCDGCIDPNWIKMAKKMPGKL